VFDIKTLLSELKLYKRELFFANFIAILAVLVNTPTPLLIPLLVDEVVLKKGGWLVSTIDKIFIGNHKAWFYIVVVLALTITLRAIFFTLSIWQNYIFTKISQDIVYKIRLKLLAHLERVDLQEYEKFTSAKVSSLMVVDLATIDIFLSSSISKLIISVLTFIGVAVVLMLIDWRLALFILSLNPLIIFFSTKLARKVGKIKRRENSLIQSFSEAINETLDFYEQVRVSNKGKHFFDRLKFKAKELKDVAVDFRYKSDASAKFSFLLFLGGFELFRAVGILMVLYSGLTIGLMLAVFGYLWVIMTPIQEIINIQYAYHNAKEATKRINELFKLEKEPKNKNRKNPFKNSKTNSITVKNLKFSYDGKEDVLKDISLEFKKGEQTAIIGGSGSGKSTLAKILVGFYSSYQGNIRIDGISYRDIGLKNIRENIFLVLQNPTLFNNTLRYNLTFGDDISEEKIKKAIEIAELNDVVKRLEKGLDTKIGKGGINLSGGERQRVSIARMIVKDPNIIILDESTSALDSLTEDKLFTKLKEYLKNKTTIIIAHRLSIIKDASRVYELKEGYLKNIKEAL
jgi:ATP-binding cassette subfamily C protein